ncbi:cation channel family protein [Metarhizium album ARSEF 1941]|uniref:Calcium-channel protein CCH1 n=1 Tax=Metarhizium album (strain ARSEF 1941) TaxID=1081103 RepID=A0A0B2X0H2_METAS|nr:cation channel family protein [Metarhizium album ARSEF 1941]KHN98590.1 cation channel family protein [Metarhizium album ARSEF 1941]
MWCQVPRSNANLSSREPELHVPRGRELVRDCLITRARPPEVRHAQSFDYDVRLFDYTIYVDFEPPSVTQSMSSNRSDGSQARRRHSIPLQDFLSAPLGGTADWLPPSHQDEHTYHRADDGCSPAVPSSTPTNPTHWYTSQSRSDDGAGSSSPINPTVLQAALPPDFHTSPPEEHGIHVSHSASIFSGSPYIEEPPSTEYDDSDRVPLTAGAQPISGSMPVDSHDANIRSSFQTVSDFDCNSAMSRQSNNLGHRGQSSCETSRGRHASNGGNLDPGQYRVSRSTSPSGALLRAGSIVRAMSQRVVNISGESELPDHRASRPRSRSPVASRFGRERSPGASMLGDTTYRLQTTQLVPEKMDAVNQYHPSPSRGPRPNPLKGRSLGIFSPQSRVRLWLCGVLVNPYTEPFILALIVLQAILLAVEAAPSVFVAGNERPDRWGRHAIDWIMLGLFVTFTLELAARIVVSGLLLNAPEYSTIDRQKGIRAAIVEQYRTAFRPQRQKSVIGSSQTELQHSIFSRSFTTIMQTLPSTIEEQQRYQLARRAFLRHSFNRLDFVAVVSFWVAFLLGITGIESQHRIYLFRMLGCLRILRLLALTHGTAIILRSLKKAAPLLVRIAFLVVFFWLLFAIIGIQSFKSSLKRQCVWLDPSDPQNLTAAFTNGNQFCGGHLDNQTGKISPWVKFGSTESLASLVNGARDGKGFICPRGSLCLQQNNPHKGTVNFDNIANSLELVFVIMSANTFSDLMYQTMASDYLQAALFFGAGIMIMLLWLTNLLIAVITSSFQVIREESKSSAFTADSEPALTTRPEERVRKSRLHRIYDQTKAFWVLLITFALLCQSLRSFRMSNSREKFIHTAEVIATLFLDIEVSIRFAADWRGFYRSWRNIFDLFLAVVTTIILVPPIPNTRAYLWLTVFQILRVYRIVLAIPVTRKLILLVLGNAAGIANLMLFVFLMTFLVAIFASQLFRGEIPQYTEDGQLNRISFFTIYNSFLGMYQILSSENWTEILYNVTSYSKRFHTAWIGAMFLIGWFILSFFILINMFIAVIQENFDVSEDEKRLEQVKAFLQRKELGHNPSNLALSTIFSLGKSRRRRDPLDYGPAMMEMLLKDAVVRDFLNDESPDPMHENAVSVPSQRSTTALFSNHANPGMIAQYWKRLLSKLKNKEPNPFYANIRFDGPNDALDPRQMARQAVSATSARRKAQREYLFRHPRYNDSLYIFKPKHTLRRLCQKLVGPARGPERFDGVQPNKVAWYVFSAFVYAVVVAMVILACVTTPLYQKEYRENHSTNTWNWYVWTDLAFTSVFTVEAAIKAIADGLFWTPNAYMRSSWGMIDGIVLVTLWINVITLLINDGAISRAVGAFKALRALRLLNVSDSARDTFHSLIIVGWWKLIGAALISLSLLIPFAIYGLNLFNGLMITCNDSSASTTLDGCFGEFDSTPFNPQWNMLAPRVAANPYFKFDDFGSSLFTLFQIVSQEGWIDVSFAAQAIVGKGMQPQPFVAQGNALFFVIFNLMATVFVLTLFISVFMRNYTEQTGVAFLTAEQRSWLELRKLLRQISPSKSSYRESEKSWKKWCHKRAIEKRGKWYQAITVVLVFHLGLLMTEFSSEPFWWTKVREIVFLLFILTYISNIAIRVIGLGWARFRKSSWDLYSLIAVSGAFVSTLALMIADATADASAQLHKFFLVAIVLLLIPRNDALDQLFKTAAASLPIISNLLATWLVCFLVFAIAMTQAFSLTRFGDQETGDINFRSVPKALILLFRMSLGEGWNQIMEDYAEIRPPLCVEENKFFDSDCGSKGWARFLFVAWNIISMYIFVNLFVSLIYESFSYVYQRSSGMAVVDRDEIRRFKEAWRSVDPAGTGFISKELFPRLLAELSGVFQMRIYQPEDSIGQILEDVRDESKPARHMSIATANFYNDVDIAKLNQRLARLDVQRIRERRRRFKVFFGEVLVSADPDRGIAFTDVLLILAHYNIINDSKSLKLEEFLRRRARLQRVDEEIRRKVVQGFFDTLYWSRRFKKHMEEKRASRMSAIPQLTIPHILVDDEPGGESNEGGTMTFTQQPRSTKLSREEGAGQQVTLESTDLSLHDTAYEHPLSQPRTSRTSAPREDTGSGFSFELYESEFQIQDVPQASRGGSATSPVEARDILDDSIWMESIRRSATLRRPNRGAYRFGDLR